MAIVTRHILEARRRIRNPIEQTADEKDARIALSKITLSNNNLIFWIIRRIHPFYKNGWRRAYIPDNRRL